MSMLIIVLLMSVCRHVIKGGHDRCRSMERITTVCPVIQFDHLCSRPVENHEAASWCKSGEMVALA